MSIYGRIIAVLLALWGVSACTTLAPEDIPAQLEHTPGPFVSVTERHYRNDTFFIAYPDSWRVITSPASEPPYVITVNPENTALMVFGVETVDPLPQPDIAQDDLQTETRLLPVGDTEIFVALVGDRTQWDTLLPLFELMLTTARPTE